MALLSGRRDTISCDIKTLAPRHVSRPAVRKAYTSYEMNSMVYIVLARPAIRPSSPLLVIQEWMWSHVQSFSVLCTGVRVTVREARCEWRTGTHFSPASWTAANPVAALAHPARAAAPPTAVDARAADSEVQPPRLSLLPADTGVPLHSTHAHSCRYSMNSTYKVTRSPCILTIRCTP